MRIDNEVAVTLTPPDPVTFQEAVYRLSVLLRFFALVLGREQPLVALTVRLCGQTDNSLPVEISRSLAPDPGRAGDTEESRSPHPADVLVSVVDSAEQYSTVLRNYLAWIRSATTVGHGYEAR